MNTINWSGYKWITQQRWGKIHNNNTKMYYDENSVIVDGKGHLHLLTQYKPKEFNIKGKKVISPYSIGLVSCKEKFGHGKFEIKAKLPSGYHLWPAFWFWSWDSWPPEVDIFEAYSHKNRVLGPLGLNYFYPFNKGTLSLWDIKSNYHYLNDKGNKEDLGAKPGFMGFRNPSKNFIKYSCIWTKDKIEIFYNEHKVRGIYDPKILSSIKNYKMNVIINNAVQGSKEDNNTSDLEIKYFKYKKLNEN